MLAGNGRRSWRTRCTRSAPICTTTRPTAAIGSQRMLTLTLKHLVEDGLVVRTAYAEVPPRVE